MIRTLFAMTICLSLTLTACSDEKTTTHVIVTSKGATKVSQVHVVREKTLSTKLYFSGTIKPLSVVNVPSPVEGAVINRNFNYGERVKKGQLLFKIDSEQLIKDYNNALTEYLRAKEKLQLSKNKFEASTELYKLGIISRNEFAQDKSSLNNDRIGFVQALHTLQNISTTDKSSLKALQKLTIEDVSKIEQALKLKYNYLDVVSPADGIALYPPENDSDDGSGPVNVGSQVKLGQVLASVGNLNGISANINVSEVNIGRIEVGQKVTITGVAFPKQILQGHVKDVTAQAKTGSGTGNIPAFPAVVVVPKLTAEQRTIIRVGMSAKIEVNVERKHIILVPIDAVYRKGKHSFVKKQENGKIIETIVTTGETTFNNIEIHSGLNVGDKLIYTPKDQVIVND